MPALPPRRPRPPAGRGRTSRLLPWVALLLPLGYVGTILAVTAHEVLGHGGAALLAGGEFRGFSIHLDGMGYARTRAPDDRILVLASGIAVETILGLVLLGAGLLATRKTLPRAALAVLALAFFLDGLPYGFWDAWFQGPRGDMGRILALSDWPPLRAVLLAGLGLLYVGTTGASCWLLFRAVESDLGPLSLRAALFVAGGVALGVVAGFAAGDWDRLIPGAGLAPVVGAALLQTLIAIGLVLTRRRRLTRRATPPKTWILWISGAWVTAAVLVAVLALWLERGVQLG